MRYRYSGITCRSLAGCHPIEAILAVLDGTEITVSKAERFSGIVNGKLRRLLNTPERFASDREFVMDIAVRLAVGLSLCPEEAILLLTCGTGYRINLGSVRDRCRLFFIRHVPDLKPADCDSLLVRAGMEPLRGCPNVSVTPGLTDKASLFLDDFLLSTSDAEKDANTLKIISSPYTDPISYFMKRKGMTTAGMSSETGIPENVIEIILLGEQISGLGEAVMKIIDTLALNECERTACLAHYGFDTGVYTV